MSALLKTFQGVVGLAAVGRAHMKDKHAFHLPGPRVFLLRLLFYRLQNAPLDGFRNVEQLVRPLQRIGEEITAYALHLQHLLQILTGQAVYIFQVLSGKGFTEFIHLTAAGLPLLQGRPCQVSFPAHEIGAHL